MPPHALPVSWGRVVLIRLAGGACIGFVLAVGLALVRAFVDRVKLALAKALPVTAS